MSDPQSPEKTQSDKSRIDANGRLIISCVTSWRWDDGRPVRVHIAQLAIKWKSVPHISFSREINYLYLPFCRFHGLVYVPLSRPCVCITSAMMRGKRGSLTRDTVVLSWHFWVVYLCISSVSDITGRQRGEWDLQGLWVEMGTMLNSRRNNP